MAALAQSKNACPKCSRSFLTKRYDSCERSLCKAYAAGNIATNSAISTAIPDEVIEFMREAREAIGSVAMVAGKNKAGDEEVGGDSPKVAVKRGKKTTEYMTAEESIVALDALNAKLGALHQDANPTGSVHGLNVLPEYYSAFNLDGFRTGLLSELRGGAGGEKHYLKNLLRNDSPTMSLFERSTLDLWTKFNSGTMLFKRISSAFDTVTASLDRIEQRILNGELPSEALRRSGTKLLGTFEPYGEINDEVKAHLISVREASLNNIADEIQSSWAKDGKKVVAAIKSAFDGSIKNDPALLLAAGHQIKKNDGKMGYSDEQLSIAAIRASSFLSGPEITQVHGAVFDALTNGEGGVLPLTATEYLRKTPELLNKAPGLRASLIKTLSSEYINRANQLLEQASQKITPIINRRIDTLATSNALINTATVMVAINDYFATEEGSKYKEMRRKHIKALINTLRREYGKANPLAQKLFVKTFTFNPSSFNAAVKDIVKDLMTNSLPKIVDASDAELSTYLEDENCFVIASANGVLAKEWNRYALEDKKKRAAIVELIREALNKLKATESREKLTKKRPDREVSADREKNLQDAKDATEKRKRAAAEKKAARQAELFAKVEEARVEVSKWNSDLLANIDTVAQPLVAVPQMPIATIYSQLKGKLAEQRTATEEAFFSAYNKVASKGGDFAEFVRLSGISSESATGTLVHRMAWDALELSSAGRDRRTALVKSGLDSLSIEAIDKEYLSVGLPYEPAMVINSSRYVAEEKSWENDSERYAYIVAKLVSTKYSTLAQEAPFELSNYDTFIRAGDTLSKVPPALSAGLTKVVVDSIRLAREAVTSPGDTKALYKRKMGVKELRHLIALGESYESDITVNLIAIDPNTEKGLITAQFAKISSADKTGFINDIFSKWKRKPKSYEDEVAEAAAAGVRKRGMKDVQGRQTADLNKYSTTYPPYLLDTKLGQDAIALYGNIYDRLSEKYPDRKPITEDKAQEAIASGEAASDKRANEELDKLSDDEKKAKKDGEELSVAEEVEIDEGEDDYEDDGWLVKDDPEDAVIGEAPPLDNEPPEELFLRNNPNPAFGQGKRGETTVGFGTATLPAFRPQPPSSPAVAKPDVVMTDAIKPAVAPPTNILVPRRKAASNEMLDPFGPDVLPSSIDSTLSVQEEPLYNI